MRGPEKYLIFTVASSSLLAALGMERLYLGAVWLRAILCAFRWVCSPCACLSCPLPWPDPCATGFGRDLPWLWPWPRSPGWPGGVLGSRGLDRRYRDGRLGGGGWASAEFRPPQSPRRTGPGSRRDWQRCAYAWPARAPRVHRSPDVDPSIERSAPPRTVAEVQRNLLRTLIDNHATVYGIGVVPGYDAAMPSSLGALWTAGQAHVAALLRLAGVEYLISGIGDPRCPPQTASMR